MMNELDPIVGNWYRNLDNDSEFEIVAVDEDAQTIEIQYAAGEIEEIEMDTWYDMPLEAIDAPEDWSGPFDDLDPDDLGYSDSDGGSSNRAKDDPLGDLY